MFKVILLFMYCGLVFSSGISSDIVKCSAKDDQCFADRVEYVLRKYSNGHPGLNLPSIDPLILPYMLVDQGGQSPVRIKMTFTNLEVRGLKNAKVVKAVGFRKEPNKKFEIRILAPMLEIYGDYDINGNMIVLPIQGSGKCNYTLTGLDISSKFLPESYIKDGKTYFKTNKTKIHFDAKKINTHFTNLFGGDVALGNTMNAFLNENWREILAEIKPTIIKSFSDVLVSIYNKILMKLPYEDMYADN